VNELWRRLESAKRRWIYGLLRLGLPLVDRTEDPQRGLLLDVKLPEGDEAVLTGHADGVITINLLEADPVKLEETRKAFREKYRTLLGHLRHESGHYYWMRLVENSAFLEPCRAVFGDDREDYQAALSRHYGGEPRAGWQDSFVSSYATAHPWEDWAETWAHYLHVVDGLETARSFGLIPLAKAPEPTEVPASREEFNRMVDAWAQLAVAMNGLNRSLGLPDPYPFPLTEAIRHKLAFVHRVVRETALGETNEKGLKENAA
jgi:hypothetical protein